MLENRSQKVEAVLLLSKGNKCDLEHLRAVKKEVAHKFAEDKRLLVLETSALDTTNVDKAFEWLVQGLLALVATVPRFYSDDDLLSFV